MKRSECNYNQRIMWSVVVREANLYIGGLENTLMDYDHRAKEYREAKAELMNFEEVRKFVEGQVYCSLEWKSLQSTHFVTRQFVDARIHN